MPIPFILGGLAIAAAGLGVKKGLDAKDDMDTAKSYNENAEKIVEKATRAIEEKKNKTTTELKVLGKTKIKVLSTSMNTFVEEFSKIKNVNLNDSEGIDELRNFKPDSPEFQTLKKATIEATDMVAGGLGAVAGSSLLAAGTYGAVMSGGFAVASTGAGIAGLSGAAATNATLAWLGGGALGAGGASFGIAGGMAVLGGIVAGPALALGGCFLASKAEDAKYKAYSNYDKAKEYEVQGKNICSMLKAVAKRAKQLNGLVTDLDIYFKQASNELKHIVRDSGCDYSKYTRDEKQLVGKTVQLAKTMKIIIDTSLLHEDGSLDETSSKSLEVGNQLLGKLDNE